MKLVVSRETILPALQTIIGVVERRHNFPILANILIEAEKEKIAFTASDAEVEIHTQVAEQVEEPGKTTVSGTKLVSIFRAFPGNTMVEIESGQEQLVIRSGKSRFRLGTLPADDFPIMGILESGVCFDVPSEKLKLLLDRTQFAMAQQDVRFYLNGLLLETAGDNRLVAVATDGHRLALSEVALDKRIEQDIRVIVPRKGVLELGRILTDSLEQAQVVVGSNHIQVRVGAQQMTSKLVDGNFPEYQRVIPEPGERVVRVDRQLLRQALTRMSILSNEKFRGIRFELSNDLLTVFTRNPEQETAEEQIEAEYDGEDFEIGFNVGYVLDALAVMHGKIVEIQFSEPDRGCVLTDEGGTDAVYVVMPMRL